MQEVPIHNRRSAIFAHNLQIGFNERSMFADTGKQRIFVCSHPNDERILRLPVDTLNT